jgi:hypothetical protein
MKKMPMILWITLGLFTMNFTEAQETVPKEVLLNTLNSFNRLKLSNLKTSELMKYNETYADKVYEVLDRDIPEKDQKEHLKTLANDRERDLKDMIGSSKTRKYSNLMDKEMRVLVHKNKLLKYIY